MKVFALKFLRKIWLKTSRGIAVAAETVKLYFHPYGLFNPSYATMSMNDIQTPLETLNTWLSGQQSHSIPAVVMAKG
jgi:hypothetical protein